MIQPERIRVLRDREPRSGQRYVLYLLQQANRAAFNPALEHAIALANDLDLPVVAAFGLLDGSNGFPEANARHYAFLLQGLSDCAAALEQRGVGFVIRKASPAEIAIELAKSAAALVLDRGYLGIQKRWYAEIEQGTDCRLVQVEGDVVVPVETASPKHEFAARTLRPKLYRAWERFLQPLPACEVKHRADGLDLASDVDIRDPDRVLAGMQLDTNVGPVRRFRGGYGEASRRLAAYVADGLAGYGAERNKPEADAASHMSPYLHFGQISPVEIALTVRAAKDSSEDDRRTYLEELVVRRELAANHVFYTERYDAYAEAVPEWARKTLDEHAGDARPYLYDLEQLARGETHEPYWNAAMREMRETGYMHNQLRMYWGKKILEWSPSPEVAFAHTLRLNNRYFLDGRDANSFTNVAWVFGLHDRPWQRRPVFGTVRYQSANSLRKFDADAYVETVDALCARENTE